MNSNFKQALYTFLGLVFICIGIALCWIFLTTTWSAFISLPETVQAVIAAALISFLSTVSAVVYTKIKERKLQIEANNTAKKQKLYTTYTNKIIDLMANPELSDDDKFTNELKLSFMKSAILWADKDVLKAYHNFRVNAQSEEEGGSQALWDVATLFLKFRKDLGLSNKKLDQHTLLEILIDIRDLDDLYVQFPKKKK